MNEDEPIEGVDFTTHGKMIDAENLRKFLSTFLYHQLQHKEELEKKKEIDRGWIDEMLNAIEGKTGPVQWQ